MTEENVPSNGQRVRNVSRLPGNAATRVYSRAGSCRCHEDGRLRLYACDCLSAALCLECTRPTADSGVFMCAVRRQLAPSGRPPCCLRDFCVKPGTVFFFFSGPFPPSQAARQCSLFIRHQRLVLFVCAATSRLVSCLLFIYFSFPFSLFFKVAACGAPHMIPVWSCSIEMDARCEA